MFLIPTCGHLFFQVVPILDSNLWLELIWTSFVVLESFIINKKINRKKPPPKLVWNKYVPNTVCVIVNLLNTSWLGEVKFLFFSRFGLILPKWSTIFKWINCSKKTQHQIYKIKKSWKKLWSVEIRLINIYRLVTTFISKHA